MSEGEIKKLSLENEKLKQLLQEKSSIGRNGSSAIVEVINAKLKESESENNSLIVENAELSLKIEQLNKSIEIQSKKERAQSFRYSKVAQSPKLSTLNTAQSMLNISANESPLARSRRCREISNSLMGRAPLPPRSPSSVQSGRKSVGQKKTIEEESEMNTNTAKTKRDRRSSNGSQLSLEINCITEEEDNTTLTNVIKTTDEDADIDEPFSGCSSRAVSKESPLNATDFEISTPQMSPLYEHPFSGLPNDPNTNKSLSSQANLINSLAVLNTTNNSNNNNDTDDDKMVGIIRRCQSSLSELLLSKHGGGKMIDIQTKLLERNAEVSSLQRRLAEANTRNTELEKQLQQSLKRSPSSAQFISRRSHEKIVQNLQDQVTMLKNMKREGTNFNFISSSSSKSNSSIETENDKDETSIVSSESQVYDPFCSTPKVVDSEDYFASRLWSSFIDLGAICGYQRNLLSYLLPKVTQGKLDISQVSRILENKCESLRTRLCSSSLLDLHKRLSSSFIDPLILSDQPTTIDQMSVIESAIKSFKNQLRTKFPMRRLSLIKGAMIKPICVPSPRVLPETTPSTPQSVEVKEGIEKSDDNNNEENNIQKDINDEANEAICKTEDKVEPKKENSEMIEEIGETEDIIEPKTENDETKEENGEVKDKGESEKENSQSNDETEDIIQPKKENDQTTEETGQITDNIESEKENTTKTEENDVLKISPIVVVVEAKDADFIENCDDRNNSKDIKVNENEAPIFNKSDDNDEETPSPIKDISTSVECSK
eukprot:TRINITY_DN3975_c0_g1_i1.p1 TRINITY_DN3975_c0_g1~~TRINITY_DN3975_c0_g1_i1.p1  ORF type:complete len:773 (+),score=244.58 TRINITY_DN3975_c0_g1_i1:91-2409(+)